MASESATSDITIAPPGKLRCVITDRLRDDTPDRWQSCADTAQRQGTAAQGR